MFGNKVTVQPPAAASTGGPTTPELWGDIYTMPANFRPAAASGKTKSWRWLVIALGTLVLAIVGLGLYLVFRPSPPPPTQPPTTSVPVPTPVPTPAPEPQPEPLSPSERDRIRYRDVREVQTALELYFADVRKYPLAPLPIVLGTDSTKVLSSGGFTPQAQGTVYLAVVPHNPEPSGVPYLYESLDGSTYSVSFRLEGSIANLTAGDHQATPQGVDGTPQSPPSLPAPKVVQPPAATTDIDQDGLTDAEEPVWLTDAVKPDTDGDGFLDGAELVAGFDPAKPQGAKLADSEALATYSSPKFGYSLRYPKAWLMKEVDPEGSEVMFSASEGEFVEVLVVGNPEGLSAAAWYAKQVIGMSAAEVPSLIVGDLTWALSTDGLNAYISAGSHIIVVSYNVGTRTEVSYRATWQAMVKLFIVPSTPPTTPVSSANP